MLKSFERISFLLHGEGSAAAAPSPGFPLSLDLMFAFLMKT